MRNPAQRFIARRHVDADAHTRRCNAALRHRVVRDEYQGERLLWHTGLWEGRYSALYLKVPQRTLTLVLLANSDGLSWLSPLDVAEAQRSPFVRAFLADFAK